jgi:hypothetical protein
MWWSSESDRFVLCSERIVLECKCKERLVLLGFEDDWRSEGRTAFECECGEELTLADRLDEKDSGFKMLTRRLGTGR